MYRIKSFGCPKNGKLAFPTRDPLFVLYSEPAVKIAYDRGEDMENRLVLTKLAEGLPAITPAFGSVLAEAGAICFEQQNHSNGVRLSVTGKFKTHYNVYWQEVTQQMLSCWDDTEYATEHAAYGVAFLLIRDMTDYTIIRRSRKGTGFDYWIGKEESENGLPFQDKARLEVSGIRKGNSADVNARLRQKLGQVKPSDHLGLPAYIVIVEFGTPSSKVVRK